MRIALPIAALLLVAGCSQADDGSAGQSGPISPMPPSSSAGSAQPSTTSTTPATPPPDGAPMSAVIAWVEAGEAADPAGFHSATRDGVTTQLGDDVAFTTPSGKIRCMTAATDDSGVLSCLADFTAPLPAPQNIYGEWVGDWVDFDGTSLTVGSVHGDPGGFASGTGAQLDYGKALRFGDNQCRTGRTGLVCVNYAHQSGARISPAGVVPFGCLAQVDPPSGIGAKFSC